jgi:hypothetical protein
VRGARRSIDQEGTKLMNRIATMLGATIAMMAIPAMAANHIVDIAWTSDGHFAQSATIEPGKFVEVCGKLEQGAVVRWDFSATAPVDFNIHYHVGKETEFPAKQSQVSSGRDTLRVTVQEVYCWMWRNKTAGHAKVDLQLQR